MGRHARARYPNSKNISVLRLALGSLSFTGHADGAAGDAGATVFFSVKDECAADNAVITI